MHAYIIDDDVDRLFGLAVKTVCQQIQISRLLQTHNANTIKVTTGGRREGGVRPGTYPPISNRHAPVGLT